MKNRERIYAERRSNVREVCGHYDNGRRWMNDTQGDKFYFDLQNGLALCTIAKVRVLQLIWKVFPFMLQSLMLGNFLIIENDSDWHVQLWMYDKVILPPQPNVIEYLIESNPI